MLYIYTKSHKSNSNVQENLACVFAHRLVQQCTIMAAQAAILGGQTDCGKCGIPYT
jgi:hypothetical protein